MEILGLVWAASIINQQAPVVMATGLGNHEFRQQPPVPIEGIAYWFESLVQVYGWGTANLEPTAAFSSYASTTSWLVPSLSSVTLTPARFDVSNPAFSPLSPVISSGLTGIQPPIRSAAEITDSGQLVALNQWHSWDAVAAVRVMESGASVGPDETSLDSPSSQCLTDVAVNHETDAVPQTMPAKLQVWVHNHFVGEVTGRKAAQRIADSMRLLIRDGELDPTQLHPLLGSNFVGVSHRSDILFLVDETMQSHPEIPPAATAIQWINNLRIAFNEAPMTLVQVQMAMMGLTETSQALYGSASWYGPGFHGRQTANGERFNENALTAAHKTLPFNTHLKVTNRLNGKSVVVRINDRGPYIGNRTLDLSKAAAYCLSALGRGVIPYEAVVLETLPKPHLSELTTAKLIGE